MDKHKTIDIICPLYNAEDYIKRLNDSFLMKKKVNLNKVKYILTESNDKTEEILKKEKCIYKKIKKEQFSHSLTRESAVRESSADIVVFVTQDVIIEDQYWLYYLTKNINHEIVACYSKQITKFNNIEKYTRERNYPEKSSVVSKKDIQNLGLRTFFFSDASSAINRKVFLHLKGYDQKKLPTNEDMYIAYKIIMNGYKIRYCSESMVIHSHNFTLKELYNRYKLIGEFFKENRYLNQYGATHSGYDLAKYILKRIISERRYQLLFRYPWDMAVRLIGMKVGKM